jgi:hypothetical protein
MITKLTEDDERQIITLVETLPEVDKRIISITQYSNGEVHVMTGVLQGRIGGGDSITVEKISKRWQIKCIGSWFA